MDIRTMLIAAAGLAMSGQAMAAPGSYADALRTMLTRTAAGTCPADIMAPNLLKACREQLPGMAPKLKAAGAVKSMTLKGTKTVRGGREETYSVTFANGDTRTWHIGGLTAGKFDSAYSDEEI